MLGDVKMGEKIHSKTPWKIMLGGQAFTFGFWHILRGGLGKGKWMGEIFASLLTAVVWYLLEIRRIIHRAEFHWTISQVYYDTVFLLPPALYYTMIIPPFFQLSQHPIRNHRGNAHQPRWNGRFPNFFDLARYTSCKDEATEDSCEQDQPKVIRKKSRLSKKDPWINLLQTK